MSFLRGSANYVWCTTSVLGKGATGAVFQGVNKNNGEPVAVKTFNQMSHMRPQEVQMREFEVLKKVKHENIVKLLAIEEEQEGRGKVIVMELCTGGSLFNILDDPENTYGLQEKEFLLVLEHLSAGMKHLRDNHLVHRDLKPGNIMKFICDDGNTVYKLTDFGAARELQEDQQFMSLYGTEEYLHPDMYERAVLRKPVGKTFGATVDLWSIGVTLYHVATGNLPFRPFGGRRNKETMFFITTKKASGVISGIQTSENGAIDWSTELPINCQLSAGLKKVVTPLLAGLLEVDRDKIWSFDRFFSEVTAALSRREVNVFHVNRAASIKVFLQPDDTYEQFQALVAEQTDIPSARQIIVCKSSLLLDVVSDSTPARGYPGTTEEEPLMLFSKENNNVCLAVEPDLPAFPVFQSLVNVENDASQAKAACSVGHVCKRRIERMSLYSRLVYSCVSFFASLVACKLERLYKKCRHLEELTAAAEETARLADRCDRLLRPLLQRTAQEERQRAEERLEERPPLDKGLLQLSQPAVQQLYSRVIADRALQLEWEGMVRGLKCPAKTRAPARAKTLVERLRDSWQHLLRDRATRSLTYNDEQFHVLERIKVTETGRRTKALLETEVTPAIVQLAECLGDWYKCAHTVYLQTMILDKDVETYEKLLEQHNQDTAVRNAAHFDSLESCLSKASNANVPSSSPSSFAVKSAPCGEAPPRSIKNYLKNVLEMDAVIANLLQENNDLIGKFEEMALDVVKLGK